MADNKVLKKTLRHYIDLEFYANSVDEEMQALLRKLIKECDEIIDSQPSYNTKAEYNIAYKLIKEKIKEFRDKLNNRLEEEAELIMNEEEKFLRTLYSKEEAEILLRKEEDGDESEGFYDDNEQLVSDAEGSEKGSPTAALSFAGISLAKILFAPIDGRDTVSQFAERTGKNILQTYDNSLRAGYLFGQSSEDIINKIDGNLKQISNGMQAGIQTAIPSFAKTTDRIFFLNNNTEVVYCAVLDGRTCIVCGNDNGLRFKSISEAPSIPQHARCRCCYIKASEVKEPLPTYEEYIESLSDEEQYHILGKNRYELWKNYNISLDKFVNNGRKLSLDELKQKYVQLIDNKNLVIPSQKFTEYALNPNKSPDKARVFKSALGYTLDNYKDLEENIRNNLKQSDMEFISENQYGRKYRCDVEITGPNKKSATVRTGWIKEPDSDDLRMTTVYVR